jgi:hypothetical protein
MLLSEATRKSLAKRPAEGQSIGHGLALRSPKAAEGAGKGAGKGLKGGCCLALLSESMRKFL